jgi:hypothetical protein
MLTTEPTRGFWCECWTEDIEDTADPEKGPALRGSFDAYSASQADRWVSVALRTISPALDTDASDEAWTWLYDERIDTRQALLGREPCKVTVTHAAPASLGRPARPSSCRSLTDRGGTSQPAHTTSRPTRPAELQLSLLDQGGSLHSPRAARPPAGPALLSPPRSSPAGVRAAHSAISRLRSEKRYVVAGAVGSAILGSHFGASLEDHGPNVVLYRAGPQTARRAGSVRDHDHSHQSSSSPKSLRRPKEWRDHYMTSVTTHEAGKP